MSSDLDNINGMTSTEIDELRTKKEKEMQELSEALSMVSEENNNLAKQILELRILKKDSDTALDKARHRMRVIASEITILKNAYWNSKNR